MSQYITGNATFTNILGQLSITWGVSNTSLIAIFIALSIGILFRSPPGPPSNGKIHNLAGFPLITAWSFFTKRYDFLRDQFKKTGLNMFSFRILQVKTLLFGIQNIV